MKKRIFVFIGILIILLLLSYEIFLKNKLDNLMSNNYEDKLLQYNANYKDLYNKIMDENNLYNEDEVNNLMDSVFNDYNALVAEIEELKILNSQYKELLFQNKDYEFSNISFIINGVRLINQYSIGYPSGCESVALTILLNYHGIDVSVKDVVEKLKKGDKPYYENDIKYGGNPYEEFVGHPSDENSYGVYDKPIEEVANEFKKGIINATGTDLDEILNIVSQNRPVVVWNSMYLATPYISEKWIYKNTGEVIKWFANEHATVIIGYTDTQIITSDSLTGTIKYFDKNKFETIYNILGKRALYY